MKNKILLWLDDVRDPHTNDWLVFSPVDDYDKVVWVKDANEFKEFINNELPYAICFDHDLGDGESGYECAKYLLDKCLDYDLDYPLFNIQSANPVGADNIRKLIENYKKFRNAKI